jgi:acetolactate synthase I/III small subunit
MQTITTTTQITTTRTGCSDAPQGTEQVHTMIMLVTDRPGSTDRVVGVLRRRRAKLLSLSLSQSETPDVVRITALVKDTNVGIEHLLEQVRKVIDVREVRHVDAQYTVTREMVLTKVNTISASQDTIIAVARRLGANVVEKGAKFVILEMSGDEERVTAFIEAMRSYGIADLARSGSVSVIR